MSNWWTACPVSGQGSVRWPVLQAHFQVHCTKQLPEQSSDTAISRCSNTSVLLSVSYQLDIPLDIQLGCLWVGTDESGTDQGLIRVVED